MSSCHPLGFLIFCKHTDKRDLFSLVFRFTKETAKASNVNMEAIIVDIDQADLEEYESMKRDLENVDDLQTECDIDDDIAEWNEEPVQGTEFETKTCEEVMEYDEDTTTSPGVRQLV